MLVDESGWLLLVLLPATGNGAARALGRAGAGGGCGGGGSGGGGGSVARRHLLHGCRDSGLDSWPDGGGDSWPDGGGGLCDSRAEGLLDSSGNARLEGGDGRRDLRFGFGAHLDLELLGEPLPQAGGREVS